jgi:hypothetical protein
MSEDFSIFAVIIAFVSVIISGFSFTLNWRKSKFDKLSSESQFISNIQNEIDVINQSLSNVKTKNECLDYVWQFLNVVDRLCYFETKNRLNGDILEFFINYLETALRHYNWMIGTTYVDKDEIRKSFPYILKTCEKHSIVEDDRKMDFIEKYPNLPLN